MKKDPELAAASRDAKRTPAWKIHGRSLEAVMNAIRKRGKKKGRPVPPRSP